MKINNQRILKLAIMLSFRQEIENERKRIKEEKKEHISNILKNYEIEYSIRETIVKNDIVNLILKKIPAKYSVSICDFPEKEYTLIDKSVMKLMLKDLFDKIINEYENCIKIYFKYKYIKYVYDDINYPLNSLIITWTIEKNYDEFTESSNSDYYSSGSD